MRLLHALTILAGCVLLPATGHAAERADVYRHAKAATALILAIDDASHSLSLGSGFFVDRAGLLLTNAHVIEESNRLIVYVRDQTIYIAPEIVAVDPDLDLAALRITPAGHRSLDLALGTVHEGEDVVAVGYPRISEILQMGFALHGTIVPGTTSGIAYGRSGSKDRLASFIQTTGLVNFGSSGGPLVSTDTGEVVGMMTTTVPYMERAKDRNGAAIGSVMMRAGISYSIPSPVIRDWLRSHQLMSPSGRQSVEKDEAGQRGGSDVESDHLFATGHLLHTMGLVLNEDGDLLNLAIRHYQSALAMRPDAPWIVRNLGRAYGTIGRWELALDAYQNILSLSAGDPVLLTDAGLAAQRSGRKDQAVEFYRAATRIDPRYGLAHINLGTLFWEQGRLDDTIAEYRVALSSDPSSSLAAYNLGLALEANGLPEEAMAGWEAFLGNSSRLVSSDVWLTKMRDAASRLKSSLDKATVPTNAVAKPVANK